MSNDPSEAEMNRKRVLVIDIGGTHVKALVTGETEMVKFDSGPALTPAEMVDGVKKMTSHWEYDVVSIGFPAPVIHGKILREPVNLGTGWMGFDFQAAFEKPAHVINDAAMQALGSYTGGRMLFLGLGTGMGAAMVDNGFLIPLEVAHLPYKRATFEDYVGAAGMKRAGQAKWEKRVHRVAQLLCDALVCEYVVLGGGNAKLLKTLPRLWDEKFAAQQY
jgi:polyphosphate glucokinase